MCLQLSLQQPSAAGVPADEPADKETSKADASFLTKILRTKLVDNRNEVEVQQKDPNSPLYSVKSFEELRLYAHRIVLAS